MVTSSALTVSQLNTYIKMMFDADSRLKRICVVGEISNFTNHYRTGHLYFSLKDNNASIKCVMFSKSAALLKFKPENGMRVYVSGRVSVFDRDGIYQIYVDSIEPEGTGALMAAFEQLKKKLASEGLFDDSHKKPLPEFPKKIAVLTSAVGAALQDVKNVISRRYPLAELIVAPIAVQGINCATDNIHALKELHNRKDIDIIIICRGGGSAEDLWGYNDEELVRTVAASSIPVITGVGHETDFTLCDFAADFRAPTPSAAAEIAVPDILELYQITDNLSVRLQNSMEHYLDNITDKLCVLNSRLHIFNPKTVIQNRTTALNGINIKFNAALKTSINKKENQLNILSEKLKILNPVRLINNGYALVFSDEKRIINASELHENDTLTITFADGTAVCEVKSIIPTERK